MLEFVVERSREVTAQEILNLRPEPEPDTLAMNQSCIDNSLCVVTVRAKGKLVGIGFVAGNARHMFLCDIFVDATYRRKGIGRAIVDELVTFTKRAAAPYVWLTYDQNQPWLKKFYEEWGFEQIGTGMQLIKVNH